MTNQIMKILDRVINQTEDRVQRVLWEARREALTKERQEYEPLQDTPAAEVDVSPAF